MMTSTPRAIIRELTGFKKFGLGAERRNGENKPERRVSRHNHNLQVEAMPHLV